MAKKTPVEMIETGFITTNHWDENLLGRNTWLWVDHFGIEGNTIRADKLDFVKYLISRGINESVQNSYQAHAKGTGLGPRVEAFNRRVADLMAGRWERGKTARAERTVDIDDMTLKMVVFKSLVMDYGISKAEAKVLIKSVDVAAAQVASRNELDKDEVLEAWKVAAQEELDELDASLPK